MNKLKRNIILLFCVVFATAQATTDQLWDEIDSAFAALSCGDYQRSIDLSREVLPKIPVDSLEMLSNVYSNFVVTYLRLGNYDQAIIYGTKALEIDEKSGDDFGISTSLGNLAGVYCAARKDEQGIGYLLRAIALDSVANRREKLAIRKAMLGEAYLHLHRYNEALVVTQEAVELDRSDNRRAKLGIRLSQLGNIYLLQASESTGFERVQQLRLAAKYTEEAMPLLQESGNVASEAITRAQLGRVQREQGCLQTAESTLLEAAELARSKNLRQTLKDTYVELYLLKKQQEKHHTSPDALYYFEKASLLKDSLLSDEVERQLTEAEVRYETAQKDTQIALHEATIRRQHLMALALGAILILCIGLLFLIIRFYHLQRVRSRELEEMNHTKDKFFQIISHDLKNPAIAQQQTLNLLKKCFTSLSEDELRDQLNELSDASDAHVNLLYDLLSWAQIELGTIAYRPTRIDLRSVVQDTLPVVNKLAKNKQIELVTSGLENAIFVFADKNMMCTILRNLVTNAIKFTDSSKKITISLFENGFLVRDEGVGMSAEQLSRIRTLSAKPTVSNKGTNGENGTGLGIMVCHELAQRNGAILEIDSTEGVGSEFRIVLQNTEN